MSLLNYISSKARTWTNSSSNPSSEGSGNISAGTSGSSSSSNSRPDAISTTFRLLGHRESVSAVAFSPNGELIASSSWDRTIRLWSLDHDSDTYKPRLPNPILRGHSNEVSSVAFSPDNSSLASASYDRTLRIWDVQAGKMTQGPFAGHTDWVTSVAYSPDGLTLLSGSRDRSVRLWDAKTTFVLRTMIGHSNAVTAVAFSPDGKLAVSASEDKTIAVWDSARGVRLGLGRNYGGGDGAGRSRVMGHQKRVTAVAFSPNSKFVVSAGAEGTICVWEARTGSLVSLFDGAELSSETSSSNLAPGGARYSAVAVSALAFSPDGRYFVTGSTDKAIRIRDAESGKLVRGPFGGHTGIINSIGWSLDGKKIVSGSKDMTIRVWVVHGDDHNGVEHVEEEGPEHMSENLTEESPFKMEDPVLGLDELWGLLHRPAGLHHSSSTASAVMASSPTSKSKEPPLKDWTGHLMKGRRIGGGGFGDVYTGQWTNMGSPSERGFMRRTVKRPPNVVIKIMRSFVKEAVRQDQAKSMKRELAVWHRVSHPNIVPFVGVVYGMEEGSENAAFSEVETEAQGDGSQMEMRLPSMISLWMENGNLKEYVQRPVNKELLKAPLLLQVARGLSYLHHFEPEIVHGDLKADNIFVSSSGALRIGDFGLSRMLSDESLWLTTATQAGGTARWMAPELLDGRQKVVWKESDIWAFGMVGLEIFTQQVPFPQYTIDGQVITALVMRQELPERPDGVTNWLWELLVSCWAFEPNKRVKVEDIVRKLEDFVV